MSCKVGGRVIALQSIKNNVAYSLGGGVFKGYEIPNAVQFPHLRMFSENNIPNPRIDLDSGGVVWGCECWWGSEESVTAQLASKEVVSVTVEQLRAPVTQSKETPNDYVDDDVQSL